MWRLCQIPANGNSLEKGKVLGSKRLNTRGHTLSGKGQRKVSINEKAEEHTQIHGSEVLGRYTISWYMRKRRMFVCVILVLAHQG